MDINVTVKCPDLVLAATAIAKVLQHLNDTVKPAAAPIPETVQAPVNPTPAPAVVQPVGAIPAPSAPAPTVVPTTPAPAITGDMVAKAGADLLRDDPKAYPALMSLLQKYGVGCAQELRPDQIGPFATEMRALGAKI